MSNEKATYDIFLSYAAGDRGLAAQVSRYFADAGLLVFDPWDQILAGETVSDRVWEALLESTALVAIVRSGGVPPSLAIEVGAAKAWSKPIYVLTDEVASVGLPGFLSSQSLLPISRLAEVIESVRRGIQPLDEKQRDVLTSIYLDYAVPVDQLLTHPSDMERLAREFRKTTGTPMPWMRLARELLRLRKTGRLVRPTHKGGKRQLPRARPAAG